MRVTCLVKRYDHHTASGGYDRLAAAVGAQVIMSKQIPGLFGKAANSIKEGLLCRRHILPVRRLVERVTSISHRGLLATRRSACALLQPNLSSDQLAKAAEMPADRDLSRSCCTYQPASFRRLSKRPWHRRCSGRRDQRNCGHTTVDRSSQNRLYPPRHRYRSISTGGSNIVGG